MLGSILKKYLASLSYEELLDLFGGPDEVAELLVAGFLMCSEEQKQRLRQAFFGKELWSEMQAFSSS